MLLLIFITLSVGCLSNSHCQNSSSLKPYCNPETNSCEECYTDSHCKNNNNCNSVCRFLGNRLTCQLPFNETALICNSGSVCYEAHGKCVGRCYTDEDCGLIPFVLRHPNTGVCDNNSGKCYDCLSTSDCKPYRNETCNAKCTFNQRLLEYQCGDGNLCGSGQYCRAVSVNDSIYRCNSANIYINSYILIIMAFFILL